MRKIYLTLLILLISCGIVFSADVSLKITGVSYQPQDTVVSFMVQMENSVDVYGLQFDVVDQPDLFNYDSLESQLSNWQVASSEPDGQVARVLIYSIMGDHIASGTSDVVKMYFSLKDTTDISQTVQFKLTAIVASDESGTSYSSVSGDSTSVDVLVSLDDLPASLPARIQLYQNFPNPFNPETSISFAIPRSQEVLLNIYNLKGELIRTLIAGRLNPGYYTLRWDARDNAGNQVPSGMYIYTLSTSGGKISQKMLLLR